MMTDCLFCKIINTDIPAEIIYQDEQVLAFNDIDSKAPYHFLIIPKKHISTLNDIGAEEESLLGHMVYTAKRIAKDKGFAEEGYRLVMNCNEQGGQTVFHIHMHVLAGRDLQWPPG